MASEVPIPLRLPPAWRAVQMFANDPKIILLMAPRYSVTVDLRRRNFALGITIVHKSQRRIRNRRGWEITLFGEAVEALQKHLAATA